MHYFGVWEDAEAALDKYLKEKDDLTSGKNPRDRDPGQHRRRELVNRFLTAKKRKLDAREPECAVLKARRMRAGQRCLKNCWPRTIAWK